MSTVLADGAVRPAKRGQRLTATLIVVAAVWLGLAAGDRSAIWWMPLAVLAGAGVLYAGARWPFAGLLVMLGSTILLVVVRASGQRSINLIDVLLLPVLLASALGRARLDAHAHAEDGPLHGWLTATERRFTNAVLLFYLLAVLSLLQLARIAGVSAALDSGLVMVRAFQGLMLYPLCMWWLRTPERVGHAWNALFVAGIVLAIMNIIGIAAWDLKRAGMTLYLNDPEAPFASPNEAGTATLLIGVVLLVRHSMRPDWKNIALGALMILLLALTQSRSAMLAWLTFGLITLRGVRPSRILAGILAIITMLPLLPHNFWERMTRTVTVDRGSYEAMSFFQRVYVWRVAWDVFLDHPWTGVGYLGYRFVSHGYNELRLVLITVENYFYEILVSMGIPGLVVLAVVFWRLFRLGREVGRVALPGSLAHHMARYHTPFLLGLLVANLTGDNFMGMVSIAQLALWTAVLVRSGHAAVPTAQRA